MNDSKNNNNIQNVCERKQLEITFSGKASIFITQLTDETVPKAECISYTEQNLADCFFLHELCINV